MEQLIKLVAEQTGITEAQAKQSIKTVLDFLKVKLPSEFNQQIEKIMEPDSTIKANITIELQKAILEYFEKKTKL